MARFIRFVVRQRIKGQPRNPGIFAAAYFLRDRSDLLDNDKALLESLLGWFESKLAIPPKGTIPPNAIFWYGNAAPFSERLWELIQLLREYDIVVEHITNSFVGKVVYQDKYQVAAIPRRRGT
jgi:hypothetical protein